MGRITLHDKTFDTYISASELQQRIRELAGQLNRDYAGKRPLYLAILNGSFMFAADLFKHLHGESEICFVRLQSYAGTSSTGNVITAIGLDHNLENRDVVILEDIVDTGKTLSAFIPDLWLQRPASLRIVSLLMKPEALSHPLTVDLVGFEIPDRFVVGYGLDYDGLGRNLEEIYQLV